MQKRMRSQQKTWVLVALSVVPTALVLCGEGCSGESASKEVARVDQDAGGGSGRVAVVSDAGSAEDALAQDSSLEPEACGAQGCSFPPSICLDESTLRWYAGRCTDAGTCEITPVDMKCPVAPMKPDCFQGACRMLIVR